MSSTPSKSQTTANEIHRYESEMNISIAACSKLVVGRAIRELRGEITMSIGSVGNCFSIDASFFATIGQIW